MVMRLSFITIATAGGTLVQAGATPYIPDANTLFLFHFDETYGGSATTN